MGTYMTENQEKELFTTLVNLVTGVNEVKLDVRDIRTDVREIKMTQAGHSDILGLLVSKVDSIAAGTVMTNDRRLTGLEKSVDDLRDRVH